MATRALVLGGGGPVGIAWETGLAAGMAEAGLMLKDADFIMGTSAGSVVGALMASGRDPRDTAAAMRSHASSGQAAQPTRHSAPQAAPDTSPLMQMMGRIYSDTEDQIAVRKELGQFSLNAKTMPEADFIATSGRLIAESPWPQQRYLCTAVDVATGEFKTWDNDSGVPLSRAVASSCSVPGIYPPITIYGARYMDGGMRSSVNADVATGYDHVLVVAVRAGAAVAANNPMAEVTRKRLEAELETLRSGGATVELITPDAGVAEVMGINLMDFTRRGAVLEQGMRQGREAADRLKDFWTA
jgi:NTE family protein